METCAPSSLTAIVKPTYACNLGCLYCYEGGRLEPQQFMSLDTLRNVIKGLAEYHGPGRTTHIIWHGGEPLLMGLDFFRAAVQIQREMGEEYGFDNSIQTNATLLTDEVLDFFEENDFSVGTSLDGPQWLHDFQRPYLDGHSSFVDILQTVERMNEHATRPDHRRIGGGVIAVLTKPVLPHLDEFYEFFRDHHIPLKINPIFYVGNGATIREKLGITPVEYGKCMVYLFDRWFNEPEPTIDIDPFDLILGNLMTQEPYGCQFAPACYDSFIAVGPEGNVYPCGRWSSTEPFQLGNLNLQSMEEIRQSPLLEQFRQGRLQARLACLNCQFHPICNSGCVENSYLIRQRLSDRDYYCGGYKVLFRRINDALMAALDQAVSTDGTPGETDQNQIITILDRQIDLDRIQPPALVRVIEKRIVHGGNRPVNWKECKETQYYDWNKYEKYTVYNKYDKYSEYREVYTRTWRDSKYREHSQYSDHSQSYYSDYTSPMC